MACARPIPALCMIASVLCTTALLDATNPDASSTADRAADIRAGFDRINRVPSYFSEMDQLKDMVTQEDLPLLHTELLEGQGRARRASAWILAHISSPESIDPLRKALANDGDRVVRWEAAHTLGHIGATSAEPDLIRALQTDPEHDVRARAAEALNMLGTPRALLAIRQAALLEQHRSVQKVLKFLLANARYTRDQRAALRPGQVSEGYFKGTCYLVYMPPNMPRRGKRRWLISIHGTWGDPELHINLVRDDADRNQVMVLAPHFDYGQYSWFGMFNLRRNKIRPDLRTLEIIEDLSRRAPAEERLLLFGHSEGGQFVNRFVLAHPDRVARAVSAGSGMLLRKDPAVQFPTGTGPNALAPDLDPLDFSRLVQTPLSMVLGTEEEAVRRQRVDDFMRAVEQYAQDKSITSKVEFIPVPGGGHSSVSNWTKARALLFADP